MDWNDTAIGFSAPIIVKDGPHRVVNTSALQSGAFNVGAIVCGPAPLVPPAAILPLPITPEKQQPLPSTGLKPPAFICAD
jgi:hypothetical protein